MKEDTQMKDIEEAKIRISAGFNWKDSPQGHEYWKEVIENLNNLTKETCSKCGR